MGNYDDIINLPHWEPKNHQRMALGVRAAQFAPFAALVGHDEAINETARLTDSRIELSADQQQSLDIALRDILSAMVTQPLVEIAYYVPDAKKAGGRYVTATGYIKKHDQYHNALILTDGILIPISDIIGIRQKEEFQ